MRTGGGAPAARPQAGAAPMPRMARSQSLPINRVGIDDGRLVRSTSPRRRSDDDGHQETRDRVEAGAGPRARGAHVVAGLPLLVCAAAPASSFVAHVAGTVAWALVMGRAEVGAFVGIFWLMEALGGALGIAGVATLRSGGPAADGLLGVLASMHVALLDYRGGSSSAF